jgi:hypothetical protein
MNDKSFGSGRGDEVEIGNKGVQENSMNFKMDRVGALRSFSLVFKYKIGHSLVKAPSYRYV